MEKNTSVKLKVEIVHEFANLPEKPGVNSDSGFDVTAIDVKRIYAHSGSNGERILEGEAMGPKFSEPGIFELQCNERCLIGTGIKATVGVGYEIQVRPRSSLALKRGLTVLNSPGTIDEQYRGELCVIIINTSRASQKIELGERIAQIVPAEVVLADVVETTLSKTSRGSGGFGSTNEEEDKEIPFYVVQ